MHGANRLGANSLLDIVVFGRACAHHISESLAPDTPHAPLPAEAGEQSIANLDKVRFSADQGGSRPTSEIRAAMQQTMQQNAAVFRTHDSLATGVQELSEVAKQLKDVKITDQSMIWYAFAAAFYNRQEF